MTEPISDSAVETTQPTESIEKEATQPSESVTESLPAEEAGPATDADVGGLLSYSDHELFIEEARKQNFSEDRIHNMEYQWMGYLGMGDSSAWLSREWTETDRGVTIESGILHEEPMSRGSGIDAAETLAEKIAVQYRYWEEVGHIGYSDIDADTPPTYQVDAFGINAIDSYVKFCILINGVDFGTYELDHEVLFLPVSSESMVADRPATVELVLLSGELPDEQHVFVYLNTNISGAR